MHVEEAYFCTFSEDILWFHQYDLKSNPYSRKLPNKLPIEGQILVSENVVWLYWKGLNSPLLIQISRYILPCGADFDTF